MESKEFSVGSTYEGSIGRYRVLSIAHNILTVEYISGSEAGETRELLAPYVTAHKVIDPQSEGRRPEAGRLRTLCRDLLPQADTRNRLLESLASIIGDYRKNEIERITPAHVDRWVMQFDRDDQMIILVEMERILKRFYWSKERVKASVQEFLCNSKIWGLSPKDTLVNAEFLNVEERGESHRAMRSLAADALRGDYGLNIDDCGGSNQFVYLNDCVYSGTDLHHRLEPWII